MKNEKKGLSNYTEKLIREIELVQSFDRKSFKALNDQSSTGSL